MQKQGNIIGKNLQLQNQKFASGVISKGTFLGICLTLPYHTPLVIILASIVPSGGKKSP
jgi:hypothetical protein